LHADGKAPCVVFWNGNTDKNLIEKLGITHVKNYLDITTIHHSYNNNYDLVLQDMSRNKQVILSKIPIGHYIKKNGRTLNLLECHTLICGQIHEGVVDCHDPVTDVILTKCIFNYIMKTVKPSTIYSYCSGKPIRARGRKKTRKEKREKKNNNKNNH